jgi:hypothetical protein
VFRPALFSISVLLLFSCNSPTAHQEKSIIRKQAVKDTFGYKDCTTLVNTTTMPQQNNAQQDKGASKHAVNPKSNVPANDPVSEEKPAEEKVIGIGTPVSQEEMNRLKERAKKADH